MLAAYACTFYVSVAFDRESWPECGCCLWVFNSEESSYRNPPEAKIVSPVSQPDSEDARNTAMGAMSSG